MFAQNELVTVYIIKLSLGNNYDFTCYTSPAGGLKQGLLQTVQVVALMFLLENVQVWCSNVLKIFWQ